MEHKKFGLSMEGCEETILKAADLAIEHTRDWHPFEYLEIGTASGQTFSAIADYLRKICSKENIFCTGLDIPGGWSLNENEFYTNTEGQQSFTKLILMNSRLFLRTTWKRFNFALIDGCHCRKCVKSDFFLLAPLMVPGGIVVFHDTSPGCQGIHPQPICNEPINVRQALIELGLYGNELEGWEVITEVTEGHGCSVFQKVKYDQPFY